MITSLPLGVVAKGGPAPPPPEPGPPDGPGPPPDRGRRLSPCSRLSTARVCRPPPSTDRRPRVVGGVAGGEGRSMTALSAPLVVVLGASGGLGASTWAAALAWRMSLHLGECVLVDGDVCGGGLDMTCGTEHVPGLRWADLSRMRGAASCARLLAALPCGEVPLLSAGGSGA